MASKTLLILGSLASYALGYATNLADEDFTLQGASAACNATLNTGVDCPITILTPPNSRYYTSSELSLLCTSTCTNALTAYVKNIQSSCSGFQMVDADSTLAFAPQIQGQYYIYGQMLACQKDSKGNFCSLNDTISQTIVSDGTAPTATGSKAIKVKRADISSPCSECSILNLQAQLDSSFGYDGGKVALYQSLTSSCASTNYPYTSPTPLALNGTQTTSAVATSTPTCAGATYSIKSGDTCQSISTSQKISTYNLLSANGLVGSCVNFPTTGSLCIPSELQCSVHTVTDSDTCVSMASQYNVTITQLLSWNYQFNTHCTNLNQSLGMSICVSNPRSFVLASVSDPGTGAMVTSASTAAPVPTDLGPQVNTDCGNYYEVKPGDDCALIYQKFSISQTDFLFLNPNVLPNCTNLWANASYCVLPVGNIMSYPGYPGGAPAIPSVTGSPVPWDSLPTIANLSEVIPPAYYTPAPLANDTRSDCTYDFTAYSVSNCSDVVIYYGVSMEEFLAWNPSLSNSSNCALTNGTRYCARLYDYSNTTSTSTLYTETAPGPTPSGQVAGCQDWWYVEKGDTCALILSENDITLANFYAWNPTVGAQCQNLWASTAYCIYGPNYNGIGPAASSASNLPFVTTYTGKGGAGPTTTSKGPTTTKPSVSVPGPTRTGTVADCTKFYLVQSPDTCSTVLAKFGITIAQFYLWNPTVNNDCSGMWLNEAYCVAAPEQPVASTPKSTGPTTTAKPPTTTNANTPPAPTQSGIVANCNAWLVAKSGDGCYDLANSHGITLQQFYNWNPALKGDCSGLWPNYAYCVGVSK